MNWLDRKVMWIKFNDNPHDLQWLPKCEDYHPVWLEFFVACMFPGILIIGIGLLIIFA